MIGCDYNNLFMCPSMYCRVLPLTLLPTLGASNVYVLTMSQPCSASVNIARCERAAPADYAGKKNKQ